MPVSATKTRARVRVLAPSCRPFTDVRTAVAPRAFRFRAIHAIRAVHAIRAIRAG